VQSERVSFTPLKIAAAVGRGDRDSFQRAKRLNHLARVHVPDAGQAVVAAGDQGRSVGAKGDGVDRPEVPQRTLKRPASRRLPKLGGDWLMLWDTGTGRRADFQLGGKAYQAALSPEGRLLAVVTAEGIEWQPRTLRPFMPSLPGSAPTGEIELYDLAQRGEFFAVAAAS
jgi:hypothetical protein